MTRPHRQLPLSRRVAERITHHRTARDMSQQGLARALTAAGYPINRVGVAELETGRRRSVAVDLLAAAAEAFDLPLAALLEDLDCPTCHGTPPRGFTCNTCRSGTPAAHRTETTR